MSFCREIDVVPDLAGNSAMVPVLAAETLRFLPCQAKKCETLAPSPALPCSFQGIRSAGKHVVGLG